MSALTNQLGWLVRAFGMRVHDVVRVCVHAVPTGHLEHARILPRKERTMSLFGGNRKGGKGAGREKSA